MEITQQKLDEIADKAIEQFKEGIKSILSEVGNSLLNEEAFWDAWYVNGIGSLAHGKHGVAISPEGLWFTKSFPNLNRGFSPSRKATEEEIRRALVKVVERKYKPGMKVKEYRNDFTQILGVNKKGFYYATDTGNLYWNYGQVMLFHADSCTWAEIIEDPKITVGGKEVRFVETGHDGPFSEEFDAEILGVRLSRYNIKRLNSGLNNPELTNLLENWPVSE